MQWHIPFFIACFYGLGLVLKQVIEVRTPTPGRYPVMLDVSVTARNKNSTVSCIESSGICAYTDWGRSKHCAGLCVHHH